MGFQLGGADDKVDESPFGAIWNKNVAVEIIHLVIQVHLRHVQTSALILGRFFRVRALNKNTVPIHLVNEGISFSLCVELQHRACTRHLVRN